MKYNSVAWIRIRIQGLLDPDPDWDFWLTYTVHYIGTGRTSLTWGFVCAQGTTCTCSAGTRRLSRGSVRMSTGSTCSLSPGNSWSVPTLYLNKLIWDFSFNQYFVSSYVTVLNESIQCRLSSIWIRPDLEFLDFPYGFLNIGFNF